MPPRPPNSCGGAGAHRTGARQDRGCDGHRSGAAGGAPHPPPCTSSSCTNQHQPGPTTSTPIFPHTPLAPTLSTPSHPHSPPPHCPHTHTPPPPPAPAHLLKDVHAIPEVRVPAAAPEAVLQPLLAVGVVHALLVAVRQHLRGRSSRGPGRAEGLAAAAAAAAAAAVGLRRRLRRCVQRTWKASDMSLNLASACALLSEFLSCAAAGVGAASHLRLPAALLRARGGGRRGAATRGGGPWGASSPQASRRGGEQGAGHAPGATSSPACGMLRRRGANVLDQTTGGARAAAGPAVRLRGAPFLMSSSLASRATPRMA
jgi:hypothetical protein